MNIIEANGIQLRLKLDHRISKKDSRFDPKNPTYPVKIGIKWIGDANERIVGERLPRDLWLSQDNFKNNYGKLIKTDLRPFLNTVIEYKDLMEEMPRWNFEKFKSILKSLDTTRSSESTLLYRCFDDKIRAMDKKGLRTDKYQTVRNGLMKFNPALPEFEEIDGKYLNRWADWMRTITNQKGEPTSEASIADYASKLRAVWKFAIKNGRTPMVDLPFGTDDGADTETFQITGRHKRKHSMPIEAVVTVMDAELDNDQDSFHRDIFALSFHLAGINMIDIVKMKWSQFDQDTNKISWQRNKTKTKMGENRKHVFVELSQEAKAIIEKHGVQGAQDDYIFNLVSSDMSDLKMRVKSDLIADKVTSLIKSICKAEGFAKADHYSFYLARHAWATQAKDMDLKPIHIMDLLGHESISTTELYMKGLSNSRLVETENLMSGMLANVRNR